MSRQQPSCLLLSVRSARLVGVCEEQRARAQMVRSALDSDPAGQRCDEWWPATTWLLHLAAALTTLAGVVLRRTR